MKRRAKVTGFTLIEMLLVLIIVSMIIYMGLGYLQQRTVQIRMDRTSLQMQQILNAGMAYYIANSTWPANLACLQGVGGALCVTKYLPATVTSPWSAGVYTIKSTTTNLYVYTPITTNSTSTATGYADIIAGTLPLAYTTGNVAATPPNQVLCNTTTCYVVASVNIPGQNLNNATAVNFAGVVSNGGCLPVPTCPVDANGNTMIPEAVVVPVSVSGVNDVGSTNVYPISSFTAYVVGNAKPPTTTSPPMCTGGGSLNVSANCAAHLVAGSAAKAYWRVCLQVITEKGDVRTTRNDIWGNDVIIAGFTRCSVKNETTTSGFTVFGN